MPFLQEPEVRQPAYAYSGLCRDTNDIGNTYVEIDLTNQRMVFYKDGQLLADTPVVTGCVRKGHSTPTGCFALDAMRSPAVLKGPGICITGYILDAVFRRSRNP